MLYARKQNAQIARYQGQRYAYRDVFGTAIRVVLVCKMCHRQFSNLDDLEVDHIIPVSVRAPETLDNLQLPCTKDNRKNGSAIRIKGKLVRPRPRTVRRKGGTAKRKRGTVKRRTKTVERKTSTARKKSAKTKSQAIPTRRRTRTLEKGRNWAVRQWVSPASD